MEDMGVFPGAESGNEKGMQYYFFLECSTNL